MEAPRNMKQLDFSNTEVLNRLKGLDHEIFTQLVIQYQSSLLSVARSIIGEALADEVVQESWVSAYKALPKFEGRSQVKTWLFTIVSNLAKTRLKKESRSISLNELEEGSAIGSDQFKSNGHWKTPPKQWHIDTPEGLLEEEQLRCCINHTLKQLPPMQKAVFTLRDLEQESLTDICNNLGLSDSNVRVLLHRARLKLMQVIEHYQETGQC